MTLKIGASLDGRTALADGTSRWITGEEARADVQRLRARASAILTGIGTVLADDPRLTVRDAALELRGPPPAACRAGSPAAHARRPHGCCDAGAPTLVFTTARAAGAQRRGVAGARIEALPDHDGRLDLPRCSTGCGELECNEVLVESGPTLAGSFVGGGLVDELVIYCRACVLGDAARPMFDLAPLRSLA